MLCPGVRADPAAVGIPPVRGVKAAAAHLATAADPLRGLLPRVALHQLFLQYPERDSNPHCRPPQGRASCRWAIWACKSLRCESNTFLRITSAAFCRVNFRGDGTACQWRPDSSRTRSGRAPPGRYIHGCLPVYTNAALPPQDSNLKSLVPETSALPVKLRGIDLLTSRRRGGGRTRTVLLLGEATLPLAYSPSLRVRRCHEHLVPASAVQVVPVTPVVLVASLAVDRAVAHAPGTATCHLLPSSQYLASDSNRDLTD